MRRREAGGLRRAGAGTQREVIRDAMLVAAESESWLTLSELARLTGYGEASISAQLRHLRKSQYGGYLLAKRCRAEVRVEGAVRGPLWEYKLSRRARRRLQHSRAQSSSQIERSATRRGPR